MDEGCSQWVGSQKGEEAKEMDWWFKPLFNERWGLGPDGEGESQKVLLDVSKCVLGDAIYWEGEEREKFPEEEERALFWMC